MDESKEVKLTPKQKAFVNAYLSNGFNGGQAAIAAGYAPDSSYVEASRLLRNAKIRELVDAFFEENTMSAREVLLRLTAHARGDIGDIWDESTGQVNWTEARAAKKTALIKRIKHKTTRVTRDDGTDVETFEDEIELHNPQVALQLLGKQHGLFVDKSEVNVTSAIILKTGMNLDDL